MNISNNLKEFLKRLFSLRNIAPLIVIITAVIGGLGVKPFGVTLASEQIIMALLAFLAVDALIERLELLTNIEQGIQTALKLLAPRGSADTFFKRRKDFPRMEQIVAEAHQEIWVAGFNLSGTASLAASFNARLQEGCKIRFLAHNPSGASFDSSTKFYVSAKDKSFAESRIINSLKTLQLQLSPISKSDMEIRVVDRVFPTGYFVIDPNSPNAKMIVQVYLYQAQTDESPLFELSKKESPIWFDVYLSQFKKAWNDAQSYQTQT